MAAMLQIKTFQRANLDDLELAVNLWMSANKVATELYIDMKITAILLEAEKNKDPKMQYTAVLVYRQP